MGKSLTPDQINRIVRNHIKPIMPIKVIKLIADDNVEGLIYMGGVYHSELDKKGKPAIELNLNYHPDDAKLTVSMNRWRRMSRRFAHVMMHEMIHMRQFRARNFKSIPGYQSTAELTTERRAQEYFGDRDEMGAFAFNIACELIDRFGYNPTAIKRYLDTNKVRRHKNSWWYNYLVAFNWNHDHKIIRRMKRKIMTQLENAYIGKPFKTTDWLTY